MSWTAIVAYLLDQIFGYQDVNELRANLIAIISSRLLSRSVGGSRQFGVYSASYVDAPEYEDVEIDGTNLGGLTIQAIVEVRTANVATAVTPKIRNTTDATDAVVGTAYSTDTAWNKQTLAFTPVTGVKVYRLQVTGSNVTHEVFGKGNGLRAYASA